MTCCRSFFFFFLFFPSFVCFLISLPTDLLPLSSSSSCCFCPQNSSYFLRVVLSVRQHNNSSSYLVRVVLPVQQVYKFLFRTYSRCSSNKSSFSFLSNLLAAQPSKHLSFVSLFFPFSFFSSSLCSLFLWSGLFCCCVLVPGTPALHLLYLDELRLFGLLCIAVVCDHKICTSISLVCMDVIGYVVCSM